MGWYQSGLVTLVRSSRTIDVRAPVDRSTRGGAGGATPNDDAPGRY